MWKYDVFKLIGIKRMVYNINFYRKVHFCPSKRDVQGKELYTIVKPHEIPLKGKVVCLVILRYIHSQFSIIVIIINNEVVPMNSS